MLNKAVELADPRRSGPAFDNEANAACNPHHRQEILRDFAGERLTLVSGRPGGTGWGSLAGSRRRSVHRVVAAEPDNAPLLGSGIGQPRDASGMPTASHPMFRPHLMQGWSPDFISRLTETAIAEGLVDEIVPVGGHDALRRSRELATQEGIFVGISSGATLVAALDVARRAPAGSHIVCMLPDTASVIFRRHCSTASNRHERRRAGAIAFDAGLSLRFSRPAPVLGCRARAGLRSRVSDGRAGGAGRRSVAGRACRAGRDTSAGRCTRTVQRRRSRDVRPRRHRIAASGAFSLEWCEFSWAVRKLFARLGIPYRSVTSTRSLPARRPRHAHPRRAEDAYWRWDDSADLVGARTSVAPPTSSTRCARPDCMRCWIRQGRLRPRGSHRPGRALPSGCIRARPRKSKP